MLSSRIPLRWKVGGALKWLLYYHLGRPILMNIEVTKRCNSRCDFCDYWRTKPEKELDDYLPVVKKVNPIVVSLTGGEPLVRKDLSAIVSRIRRNTSYNYICVMTNGILLDEAKGRELWDAGVDQLSISLDFLGDKHDRFRGRPGLFAHLEEIIPRLSAVGFDNVQLNTVIMEDNLEEIVPIARQAQEWGVRVAFSSFSALKTGNDGHGVRPESLPRLRETMAELLRLKRELGNIITSDYYLKRVPEFFEKGAIADCRAGSRWVHVAPDGFLRPCSELPSVCHYSEYKGPLPPVSCTGCWYNCRGESQAPITLRRVIELVRSRRRPAVSSTPPRAEAAS